MKTIADYQPDILIREAIRFLAECDMRGIPHRDEFHLTVMLASGDASRQGLSATHDEVAAWVAQEVTEAVADKLARSIHPSA